MDNSNEMVQLVVAWTLVGAFLFTVIITCLSLLGLVKFADSNQQKKLFYVLIVELVIVCLGFFGNILNFNPKGVEDSIQLEVRKAFLNGLKVKIYHSGDELTVTKANEIEKMLREYKCDTRVEKKRYSLDGNFIKHYNVTQYNLCREIKTVLSAKYPYYEIQLSSDPDAETDHIKIYVVN